MAPEQWIRSRNVDSKADVYALGVMLFEMLAGQLPIGNDKTNPLIIANLHLQAEPMELSQVAPNITKALCQLVQCMLAKQRKSRPAMSEVVERLRVLDNAFASPTKEIPQTGRKPTFPMDRDSQSIGVDAPTIPDGETPEGRLDSMQPALDDEVTKILHR